MRISLFFRWYDLWIGAYWDSKNRNLYICPIPTFGFKISFTGKCILRHKWSNWLENLDRNAISNRYRICNNCNSIEYGE